MQANTHVRIYPIDGCTSISSVHGVRFHVVDFSFVMGQGAESMKYKHRSDVFSELPDVQHTLMPYALEVKECIDTHYIPFLCIGTYTYY